jgi:hypothetical protein
MNPTTLTVTADADRQTNAALPIYLLCITTLHASCNVGDIDMIAQRHRRYTDVHLMSLRRTVPLMR